MKTIEVFKDNICKYWQTIHLKDGKPDKGSFLSSHIRPTKYPADLDSNSVLKLIQAANRDALVRIRS